MMTFAAIRHVPWALNTRVWWLQMALHSLEEANNAPPNPLAGFEGSLWAGKRESKGKKERENRKRKRT